MKKEKKGDMSVKMLVTIILLAIGFAIILFFYTQLGWSGRVNREVCHQSVIYRGTLPDQFETKEYVPLKCKTEKYCITDKFFGKGDCEEFVGEDVNKVRVSGTPTQMNDEINKFIAREMAECWGILAEGKLQLFPRELTTTKQCVVCSRIAFDSSVKEKLNNDIAGLGNYLIMHAVPNSDISYWTYITSGLDKRGYNPTSDKYSTKEKAILFMEIDKTDAPGWLGIIFGGGAAGTGGAILGAKIGAGIGSIVPIGGTIAGGVIGFVGGAIVGSWVGAETGEIVEKEFITKEIGDSEYAAANFFIDYDASQISELNCNSFESIS